MCYVRLREIQVDQALGYWTLNQGFPLVRQRVRDPDDGQELSQWQSFGTPHH